MQDHLFIPILFNCSYQNSWKELATSANSEKHVGKYKAYLFIIERGHEKMCLMSYANNKGADQPAHLRSLISTFVVRCLDSIIFLDSIAEISWL